jgi:ribosomal protein S18 acetylase RimI-like enzyme
VIDRARLLALYDREMREDPPESSGARFERTSTIVREVGASQDTILFSRLSSSTASTAVREEAARARRAGKTLEWKVYAHDQPEKLPAELEREGFVADEDETLVVLDLSSLPETGPSPEGIRIAEVTDSSTFRDALAVSEAAFGPSGPETLLEFRDRLSDPTARLFVTYLGYLPVAAGRLELPPGRAFAGLWGGGTVPEARHRGVYRALVRARAERARRAGYQYITVDARESSRPILERLGFVPLSTIRGWVLDASTDTRSD